MANDGTNEDEFDESKSSGLEPKKLILFVVLPLILILAGGGAAAYFMGLFEPNTAIEQPKDKEEEVKKEITASFLKIPDITVNLSSDSGQPRYLRLSIQLELASEEDKMLVEKVMPRVVDQFQTYLRELRVRDLRGSAGIYRLQMELLKRVNDAAYPVEVKDVLFQEILIQ